MMYRSFVLTAGVLMFCSGCGDELTDEASGSCDQTRTALTMEEATSLGVSAGDLLAGIQHTYSGDLNFNPDGSTVLTMVPGATGTAFFVDQEPREDSSGQEYDTLEAAYCEDYVEIQTQLSFETGDGLFGEMFDVALQFMSTTSAHFGVDVIPAELSGSYDFMVMDPADYDEVTASIYGDLMVDGSSSGMLSEVGTKVEGEGDDGTASASLATVAEWTFAAVVTE